MRISLKFAALLGLWALAASARESVAQVGVAKMDITPDYPIRLSGYAARTSESEGVEQRLWAKALAIGSDRQGPAVLLTVDSPGVPGRVRDEVSRRLLRKRGIASACFALCSTHTHCAPHLSGYVPNLFRDPLPTDEQAHIERYTRELTDALERVALAALKNRSAARVSWGQTSVAFAANRRTKGGPVDHDLPVLLVAHAQERLERDLPGSMVLAAIGCGGGANPSPRPGLENAQRHGQAIPSERLLREGGYEAGGAVVDYDQPAQLAAGVEAMIVGAVDDLLPEHFSAATESAASATVADEGSDGVATRLPRTNLLVYHNRTGDVLPVKSKADWRKRRAEILQAFTSIAGPLPGQEKRCALDLKVEAREDCGTYERQLLSYQSEPGGRVPAYLLIPKAATNSRKRLPAVLCLHSTSKSLGPRVVVEDTGGKYRAFAHDLAERGFVVLAPAYPLMANYQPDLRALGWQSGTMKAIWDNRRGLDLFDSLPFVRHGKYGALGHSLGGHNAIFTALFDDRIKAVVSSSGFDSFLDYYGGDPAKWQAGEGWCQTRYLPKLAEYRGRLAEIPFDFYELLAALAPRPVFVNAPLHDANFQFRSVEAIASEAGRVYRLYRANGDLRVEHPDCDHDFPETVRQRAYDFLAERLRLHTTVNVPRLCWGPEAGTARHAPDRQF